MSIRFNISFELPLYLEKILLWPVQMYHRVRLGCDVRIIPLTRCKFAIVDPDNYPFLNSFKWCAARYDNTFYAVRSFRIGRGKTKMQYLHKLILDSPPGLLVDHRNNDGLDNRRANLRLATPSENMFNRRKTRKKTWSRYIGVTFDICSGKWIASICYHGKTIYLGRFDSEIDAARAYDRASIKYHGEFAKLNFSREDYNVEI